MITAGTVHTFTVRNATGVVGFTIGNSTTGRSTPVTLAGIRLLVRRKYKSLRFRLVSSTKLLLKLAADVMVIRFMFAHAYCDTPELACNLDLFNACTFNFKRGPRDTLNADRT